MPDLAWMAWTWQTGVFFAVLGAVLAAMTAWAAWRPEAPRVGILGYPTTRGDRLFLTLMGSAFIHILWLGLVGGALWPAAIVSVMFGAAMFRWA